VLATDWWVAGPAIVATAATIAALFVAIETQRKDAWFRRSEQARHVNVIVTSWKYTPSLVGGGTVDEFKYEVANTSNQPVYQLEASLLPWSWDRSSKPIASHTFTVLRPDSASKQEDFAGQAPAPPIDLGAASLRPPMRLTFTDAGGVRWRRWPNGELRDVAKG
jgi:hypothetical protein